MASSKSRSKLCLVAGLLAFLAIGGASANAETPPPLKPASELKAPAELKATATEVKLPKSAWDKAYRSSKIGDFIEMTSEFAVSRTEIYDVADHAVTQVTKTTTKSGANTVKFEIATKMLFTEADYPEAKGPNVIKAVTKPSDRKFKVGEEEVEADQITESVVGDQVRNRSWTSKKLPVGAVLLVEDADGKVIVRLTAFGRGK